jgi:hypothetical protein
MRRLFTLVLLSAALSTATAQKQLAATKPVPVPQTPPANATEQPFQDKRYHVSFRVPAGWELNHKDGQVSTFHEDARSAPRSAQLRGVALLDFNPFPYSTLAGALFYYSVEPKTTDGECAAQATGLHPAKTDKEADEPQSSPRKDVQDIAGMPFTHGHDEVYHVCIEARDEVYTAWRKHACYRFDLAINTFCPEGSGAQPISDEQIHSINERMTKILSSVILGWEKAAPHPIPVPEQPVQPERAVPVRSAPSAQGNSL